MQGYVFRADQRSVVDALMTSINVNAGLGLPGNSTTTYSRIYQNTRTGQLAIPVDRGGINTEDYRTRSKLAVIAPVPIELDSDWEPLAK